MDSNPILTVVLEVSELEIKINQVPGARYVNVVSPWRFNGFTISKSA